MKNIKLFLLLIVSLSITSCASSYRPILPEEIEYINKTESQDVTLEYKFDLLEKNYGAKSKRKGEHLVAVKITNDSETTISWNENFIITHEDGSEIYKTENDELYNTLRQKRFVYFAYAPLSLITWKVYNVVIPVGLIATSAIISSNSIKAKRSNERFKRNLDKYFLYDQSIMPGEVKYGLIGLKTQNQSPLKLTLN